MEHQQDRKINIEPVFIFLTERMYPLELAELLDEFMYEYMLLLIQSQQQTSEKNMHERTHEFFLNLKLLRDTLRKCEK